MGTILGLFGLVVFILAVLTLSASVTWTVVKISPQKKKPERPAE